MTGVHAADVSGGAWAVADAVAWNPNGGSLLPRNVLRAAYKDAEAMKRATTVFATPKSAFAGNGAGNGGATRGGGSGAGAARGGAKWSKDEKSKNSQTKPAAPASAGAGAASSE